jgi:hypothetical protein
LNIHQFDVESLRERLGCPNRVETRGKLTNAVVLEPRISPYAAFRRNEGLETLKAARVQAEAEAIARGVEGGFTEAEYDEEVRRRHERRQREELGVSEHEDSDEDDEDDDMDDEDYVPSKDDVDMDESESGDEEMSDKE